MEKPTPDESLIENGVEIEDKQPSPLAEAYIAIHGESPKGLKDWEIAKVITEALVISPSFIDPNLAKDAIHSIIAYTDFPDRETQIDTILPLETGVIQSLYPEVAHIDEIHMDQEEFLHRKDLKKREGNASQ